MTYQGRRPLGARAARSRGRPIATWATGVGAVLAASCLAAVAAEAKRDFRGLETGMTIAQAKEAAARNGMTCETDFTGQTTCRGDGASVALTTTGRNGNRIWELQVSLSGHFDAAEMRARLDSFYGLKPTDVPRDYATASGQELLLLEIGETSTVFYLRNPFVLRDDTRALPPPKL